jgi:Fe-S cluster biosynthesis and repair protein YggX
VLQLNPTYSKAYEMLGKALVETGRRADAVVALEQGYSVAAERGDVMPREQIANMLAELGHAPPQVAPSTGRPATTPMDASGAPSASGFRCARCGRPHGQMAKAPFKGALGMKVLAQSCSECWKEWIPTGTKVINEMGLALADPKAQDLYDEYMKEFLQLDP